MTARWSSLVMPWDFSAALEAVGLIHDRDRISEVKIVARKGDPVTIEVTYIADRRIYRLTDPQEPPG